MDILIDLFQNKGLLVQTYSLKNPQGENSNGVKSAERMV